MCGARQKIIRRLTHINGKVPHGLNGIGVKQCIVFLTQGPYFIHRIQIANLVVCKHERDQRLRPLLEQRFKFIQIDISMFIYGEVCSLHFTALNHKLYGMTHCVVFNGRSDNAFHAKITNTAKQGHIIGLCASGSEEDFAGLCSNSLRNTLANHLYLHLSTTATDVGRRWVAEVLHHANHFLFNTRF